MPLRRSIAGLLALAGFASLARADVLDVRGPNPDFTQIQPAVLAASDGDVIRVWPGDYEVFSINDKDLTLVRAKQSGKVTVQGTYRVKNLAPGRTVEITGIGATGWDGYGLVISDCQGSVRVREAVIEGADGDTQPQWIEASPAVLIQSSADVEIAWCQLRAGDPPWWGYGYPGATGLIVFDSNLSLFATEVAGSSGTTEDDPGADGNDGGNGVWAAGTGRVYISGCTVWAGGGSDADYDCDFWTYYCGQGGSGGDAVGAQASMEVWLLDSVLHPGLGGWGPGGNGGDGYAAPSHARFLPGRTRLLSSSGLVDDTTPVQVQAQGAPGDRVFVLLSDDAAYRFHPVRGPFLVAVPPAPQRLPWRFLGTIDGSGLLQATLPAIDLPPLEHGTLHLQGTFLKHKDYFGSSSWTAVLDTAW